MAQNVKLMQEAALVDPNRGTDLGPTQIYENLRIEISSLQCRELREKVVKEFIRRNPNIYNMRDLHEQIGCFSYKTLYTWRNAIHNSAQVQPMVPADAQGMARNNSLQANPSCLLSHARQQPQPHELAIDGPRYIVGEYPGIVGQTGQHQSYPIGAAWSYAAASRFVPGGAPLALLHPVS
jgi:hypothetical protein